MNLSKQALPIGVGEDCGKRYLKKKRNKLNLADTLFSFPAILHMSSEINWFEVTGN